jgi:hypothetical protein
MGAIPHLLRSNRTGERVLLIAAGKLCSLFLRRAYEQSGFKQLGPAHERYAEIHSFGTAEPEQTKLEE